MADEMLPFIRMLQRIDDLSAKESGYTLRHMVAWTDMRAKFKQERERRPGLTQTKIAQTGGVDQSAISKIETDPKYTPLVDTFVNAIHGLGLYAAEFFAEIEGLQVVREGGKTTVILPQHGHTTSVPRPAIATQAALQTFVLDLIVILQDLVAKHDAGRDAPGKTVRRPAANPQTKARKNSRTGTDR